MGYNTVALLFNDQLSHLDGDPRAGEKIAHAVRSWQPQDQMSGLFGQGRVISVAHADTPQLVIVGMNRGVLVKDAEASDADYRIIEDMKQFLEKAGYLVIKKSP